MTPDWYSKFVRATWLTADEQSSKEVVMKPMKLRKPGSLTDGDHGHVAHLNLTPAQTIAVSGLFSEEYCDCRLCGKELDKTDRKETIAQVRLMKKRLTVSVVCGECFDDFKRTWRLLAKVESVGNSVKEESNEPQTP